MSWTRVVNAPPGYETVAVSTLPNGDVESLADFEAAEAQRRGVDLRDAASVNRVGLEIAAANGVDNPRSKTLQWGRDVASWVLGTGGARRIPSASQPNRAEPGLGFPTFVVGQRIHLPAGLRRRVVDEPRAEPLAPMSTTLPMGVVAVVVALLGWVFLSKKPKRS